MEAGKEIALMFCLARPELSEVDRARFFELLDQGIDWEAFTNLATCHKVLPLVAKHLAGPKTGCWPESLRQQYGKKHRQHVVMSLLFARRVLQIIALFQKKNISVVPFKGPVSASQLFGDVALRMYGDLDFLVDRSDVEVVFIELQKLGYVPEFKINPGNLKAYSVIEDGIALSIEGQPTIDLTWELSGLCLARPFDLPLITPRLSTVLIEGRPVPAFSAEDLVLYYSLHGTKHNWEQYELVVCLGRQIESSPVDWQQVMNRAADLRCRRVLRVGLSLARKLYGVALPTTVSSFIEEDVKAVELATDIGRAFLNNPNGGRLQDSRFRLLRFHVKDSWLDALRYMLRLFFSPSKAEWQLFHLSSGRFIFVYWLIRPFRVFYTALSGILQRRRHGTFL